MDKKYDVVIVGTGAAGLYAAISFPRDISILLVSKRELPLSNSSLAQGGVACVLDTVHDASPWKSSSRRVLPMCSKPRSWAWTTTSTPTAP